MNKDDLRSKASSMFSGTKQPDGAEKGKALRNPGPHYSHRSHCHNTGGEVVKVHHLNRMPLGAQQQVIMRILS